MMRRGFAMPVVVLLALAASIMAAVLLERQGAWSRLATREVQGYRDRHFERGLREVVGAWTDSLAGQPVEKMTADDGHILDLELPGGRGAAVYLFDGQGALLTDPAGLNMLERADLDGVFTELDRLGVRGDPSWYRPVGPVAVSAASAPLEVLEAIGNYASGGRSGRRFAMSLEEAREGDALTASSLQSAMAAADMNAQEREVVQRLVTATPDLRLVVVDVYEADAGGRSGLARRYAGRLLLAGGSIKFATSMESMGKFLSWEELPITE